MPFTVHGGPGGPGGALHQGRAVGSSGCGASLVGVTAPAMPWQFGPSATRKGPPVGATGAPGAENLNDTVLTYSLILLFCRFSFFCTKLKLRARGAPIIQ